MVNCISHGIAHSCNKMMVSVDFHAEVMTLSKFAGSLVFVVEVHAVGFSETVHKSCRSICLKHLMGVS